MGFSHWFNLFRRKHWQILLCQLDWSHENSSHPSDVRNKLTEIAFSSSALVYYVSASQVSGTYWDNSSIHTSFLIIFVLGKNGGLHQYSAFVLLLPPLVEETWKTVVAFLVCSSFCLEGHGVNQENSRSTPCLNFFQSGVLIEKVGNCPVFF